MLLLKTYVDVFALLFVHEEDKPVKYRIAIYSFEKNRKEVL